MQRHLIQCRRKKIVSSAFSDTSLAGILESQFIGSDNEPNDHVNVGFFGGGQKMNDRVKFAITNLRARVAEKVSIEWQGNRVDPGPLYIELDDSRNTLSEGTLDYSASRAEATFHVSFTFPELAHTLEELGSDPELTEPVHAVIHSTGRIREDHSFVLSGPCDLEPHALLKAEETRAVVLAGT